METEKVVIYTDGSATPNPGKGGWAALLTIGQYRKLVKGNSGDEKMTNNAAEIMAAIAGLEALKRSCLVEIITDSQYLANIGNGEWTAKSNFEQWEQLDELLHEHTVTFVWKREFTLPQQAIVHNMAERESGGIR